MLLKKRDVANVEQKNTAIKQNCGVFGGDNGIRTHDLLTASQAL